MTSRLASLLVQDGHVPAARMAEAFSRQVIYGGALDTALLELGLVDEALLVDYLAQATGLMPRTQPLAGGLLSPERLVPVAMAERLHAVPVELVGDALRVLVREPLPPSSVTELERSAGRRVEQVVVPELRLHEALERVYGVAIPPRFQALAAKLRALPPRPRSTASPAIVRATTAKLRDDATLVTVGPSRAAPPVEEVRGGDVTARVEPPDESDRREPVDRERAADVPVSPVDSATDRTSPVVTIPDAATERILAFDAEPSSTAPRSGHAFAETATTNIGSRAERTEESSLPSRDEPLLPPGSAADAVTMAAAGAAKPSAENFAQSPPAVPSEIAVRFVAADASVSAARSDEPTRREDGAPQVAIDEITALTPDPSSMSVAEGVATSAAPAVGSAVGAAEAINSGAVVDEARRAHPAPPLAGREGFDEPKPTDEAAVRPESTAIYVDATTRSTAGSAAAIPGATQKTLIEPAGRGRSDQTAAWAPRSAPTPLNAADAAAALEEAADRDAIFEVLCRATRARFEYAALLTVANGQAQVRMALGDGWLDRATLGVVSVTLDAPSAVRTAVQGLAPYVGQLGQDATLALAMSRLGRKAPRWGMLLPIVLRERAVALVYADAGGRVLKAERLVDVFQTANEAAQTFQRIILRAKGIAPPAGQDTPPKRRTPADGVATDTGRPSPVGESSLEAHIEAIAAESSHASAALEALLGAGEEGARVLALHLPGPLRTRRATLVPSTGALPSLSQVGPLIAVVPRFGTLIVPHLVARLSEPAHADSASLRAAIALTFVERPTALAVEALGGLVFDGDASVRRAAHLALARVGPSPEMRTLAESLRGELAGADALRVRLAADALGELRDIPSVPRLLEMVRHRDELVSISVRRALVTITKQDFGASRWRWRTWWEQNRALPRTEWLLGGLEHGDRAVRRSASDELATIVSELYGYHASLPRPQREEARAKWQVWWRAHEHELTAE